MSDGLLWRDVLDVAESGAPPTFDLERTVSPGHARVGRHLPGGRMGRWTFFGMCSRTVPVQIGLK